MDRTRFANSVAESAAHSSDAPPGPNGQRSSALVGTLLLFVALWAAFYGLFRSLPYLKNGSDIIFAAKLRLEYAGAVFPTTYRTTRLLIFGNSKILSGFIPARFDELSANDHARVSSFNSGFPGSDLFLPPLQALCARGQAPDILLLTLPWEADPQPRGLFNFLPDDHAAIDALFPFRNFVRDLSAFLMNAPGHGGWVRSYRESKQNEQAVIAARGYHLITEQSRFPGGRLPDNFHLASDQPTRAVARAEPGASTQSRQLNQLIAQHPMRCFYVPFYLREGEARPAAFNQHFADQIAQATPCRLLGPDYYLYPNRMFADQTHLNEVGARAYTEALFALLKENHVALQ